MPSTRPLPSWIAYAYLALAMALAGSYVALSKPLVAVLPVFLLGWLRFGIAGIAMAGWFRKTALEPPLTLGTRWLLFLESFLGNFLFSICMLYGLSMTSAVSAGVILATIPAMVALLSWVLLKERISLRIVLAVACAALGIGLLALSRPDSTGNAAITADTAADTGRVWLGNLLVFGAVVCEAFYTVIGKKLSGTVSPKRISALINLCGLLLMTPLGLHTALQFDFGAVQLSSWLLLVFYALAASVWSVWLWMTGTRHVPAAHAGVFTVLLPIAAALVGVLVLGERLSGIQLLVFAIALAGVLLATLPERQRSAAQQPPA
ncbi:MAG: DMT family transporter [Rhodoferax sp.]|nr:DMT family transporter [Rhodoferax sp.]